MVVQNYLKKENVEKNALQKLIKIAGDIVVYLPFASYLFICNVKSSLFLTNDSPVKVTFIIIHFTINPLTPGVQ